MLIKKSVTIHKHRTSIALEQEFWDVLKDISIEKNYSVEKLISNIDINRNASLASSIRVFILKHIINSS
ncbi:ribbon-helix-helix domain-containing protein [Alphaproteobacteria bacterium]|nr:ribbon-helix-helix domain-containing protein [Alphaproteobacteria bacterium]MDB9869808.1 ribbon-helix-helix domain-containing protein [Alphaproteobacteria bacterium]MDC1209960.1 ribbon-helix-helix domain-containing protein [Pseudomonadota bacterium]